MGIVITVDGMDGTGKATQSKMLSERLRGLGLKVLELSFPNYESYSSTSVVNYLKGEYGDATKLDPYIAGELYLHDRTVTSLYKRKEIAEHDVVILDRSAMSNFFYQTPKFEDYYEVEEYVKFFSHAERMTTSIFPDYSVILVSPAETAMDAIRKRAEETGRLIDKLETLEYQRECRNNFGRLSMAFEENKIGYTIIDVESYFLFDDGRDKLADRIFIDIIKKFPKFVKIEEEEFEQSSGHISELMIEVTRHCICKCPHCLRGPEQSVFMDEALVAKIFKGLTSIYNIALTGGEPFMADHSTLGAIEKGLSHVQLESFFVRTSGVYLDSNARTLSKMMRIAAHANECIEFSLSRDDYHPEPFEDNVRLLRTLKGFSEQEKERNMTLVNMGRAAEIYSPKKRDVSVDDIENIDWTSNPHIYVSANGNVVIGEYDLSYEVIDEDAHANLNDFDSLVDCIIYLKYMTRTKGGTLPLEVV